MGSLTDIEVPLRVTIADNTDTVLDVFLVWAHVPKGTPQAQEDALAAQLVRERIEGAYAIED